MKLRLYVFIIILNLSCVCQQEILEDSYSQNNLETLNKIKELDSTYFNSTGYSGNEKLIDFFSKETEKKTFHEIALLCDREYLDSLIQVSGIPKPINGENDNERKESYLDFMMKQVSLSYPTEVVSRMVQNNELPIDDLVRDMIITFLDSNYKLDLRKRSLQIAFQNSNEFKKSNPRQQNEVIKELRIIQRLYKISPSDKAFAFLYNEKLHSANEIIGIPEKKFIEKYGVILGDCVAKKVYANAFFIICSK